MFTQSIKIYTFHHHIQIFEHGDSSDRQKINGFIKGGMKRRFQQLLRQFSSELSFKNQQKKHKFFEKLGKDLEQKLSRSCYKICKMK